MIPVLAVIRIRHPDGELRLWAPIGLLWLLVLPFAVLLLPAAVAALAARRISPGPAIAAFAQMFCALAGSQVAVETPTSAVLVRLI